MSNICVKTNVSNWCTCQVSKQSIGIFFSSWLRLHLQIVSIFQILHWFLLVWDTRRLGIFEFEVTVWEGWPKIAGPKNIQHSHFDQKKPFNWIQFNDHKKLSILFNSLWKGGNDQKEEGRWQCKTISFSRIAEVLKGYFRTGNHF